jgi:hypothetical protein
MTDNKKGRPGKSPIEKKDGFIKFRISKDKKIAFTKGLKIIYGKDCTITDALMKFVDTIIQEANKKRRIT